MNIQKNILLSKYTTFKIGGPAEHFVIAKNIEEVQEAVKWAKENNHPIFMLGGGSNLLISDQGIKGLVIKLDLQNIEFDNNKITVGAGVILTFLLNQSLEHSLVGLEFATGIPGTVGGAIRGNAGTYDQAMNDVVTSIKYLDEDFVIQEMDTAGAEFAYRHSIFKTKPYIILEAQLELKTGDVQAVQQLIRERLQHRQANHPTQPSAGCIFKNVSFEEVDIDDLAKRGVEIEKFSKSKQIPSGYLIEKVGLKGKQIGGAQVSEQHANYIINTGNATAEDVIMLISLIKQQIRDKYGVQLIEEVQFING
jgi:UDP-N-acetylmuramate dehydrogenase